MNDLLWDINFVKTILPNHYIVEESTKKGSIYCYSQIGIFGDDKERWNFIFKALKNHFGERFQEVYHTTNSKHKNFTIFLKPLS